MRINLDSGQIARPGDKRVILEAFKPGTEPNGEQTVIGGGYTPSASAGGEVGAGPRTGVGPKVGGGAAAVDTSGLY